jgi:hypothetical protein
MIVLSAAVFGPVVYFSHKAQRDISEKFIDGPRRAPLPSSNPWRNP